MENLKELLKASLLSIVYFLSLTVCVKDVALDLVDEIRLKPTAIIDLMDYTLEADLLAFDQQQPISFEQEIL